jgi:putative membrane protein
MRPRVCARLGIATREQAEPIRTMAYNQGFYNLALALGVLVGVVVAAGDGDAAIVGRTLIIFGAGCMAFAGLVLATSGLQYRRAAVLQFAPAALAVVLAALA